MICKKNNLIFAFLMFLLSNINIYAQSNKTAATNLLAPTQVTNGLVNTGANFKMQNTEYGNPPAWNWAKTIGGSDIDRANAIANDADGNVYVVGSFSGTTNFGGESLTSIGHEDGFVAKYSIDGNLVWLAAMPAEEHHHSVAQKVVVDDNGNILVGGINWVLDNDAPEGIAQELVVAKFNAAGVMQWVRTDSSPNEAYFCYDLGVNNAGDIFVLVGYQRLHVYDDDMNLVATQLYDGNIHEMLVKGNELFIAGAFYNSVQLGDFNLTSNDLEAFIAKADVTGSTPNFEWAAKSTSDISTASQTKGFALTVDNLGNVYFGGYFKGSTSFDPDLNDNLVVSEGYWESFLVQYNWAGTYQWGMQSNSSDYSNHGEGGMFISTDENGYVYFTAVADATTSVADQTVNAVESYLVQLNVFGDVWGMVSNGTIYNDMLATADGQVYQLGLASKAFFVQKSFQANSLEWRLESEGNGGYASGIHGNIVMDEDQNVYCIPYISGTVDIMGQNSVAIGEHNSSLIVKMDAAGNHLWTYTFMQEGICYLQNIAYSSDGHLVVVGEFNGLLDSEDGIFDSEDGGVFVSKMSLDGEVIWMQQFKDESRSIAVTAAGNIYVGIIFREELNIAGEVLTSYGAYDACIIKLNGNGTVAWAKQLGGTETEFTPYLSVDDNENVYITGETQSTAFFYETSSITYNSTPSHIYFMKYNSNGDLQWIENIGEDADTATGDSWPYAIKTDATGNSYMIGWHSTESSFGDITLTGDYDYNIFITKFDTEGNALWAKSINNTIFDFTTYQIDIDEQGNLYLGGRFRDTINFVNDYEVAPTGERDLYFVKYANDGTLEWVRTQAGISSSMFVGGVAVYKEDQLFYAGHFDEKMEFTNLETLHTPRTHFFIAQMGEEITGTADNPRVLANTMQLQPNPTSKNTSITYELAVPSKVQIQVFNLEGKLLQNIALGQQTTGQQMYQLNTQTLPTGIYLVQVNSQAKTQTAKLEVMR